MAWELKTDRPIYMQIVETLRMRIVSGFYQTGGKIPSVRELAAEAGVNPNTMQKALADLERAGLIITQRTSGKTITEDGQLVEQLRGRIAWDETKVYLQKMEMLGYGAKEAGSFVMKAAESGPEGKEDYVLPEGENL